MTTIFFYVLLFQIKDWDKICEEEGKMTSPIICYILPLLSKEITP